MKRETGEKSVIQEKFEAYEAVRQSGVTNMWDVARVIELSDDVLAEADCLFIMKNYSDLAKQFA